MGDSVILFIGGFLGFLLGFAFSIPTLERIAQIRRSPSSSTDSMSAGQFVEITGKISTEGRSLHSPLTRPACVLWHVEVWEQKTSFEDSHWITVFNETSAHSFDINDGAGIVRIYPQDAELVLHDDFYRESGPFAYSFEPGLKTAIEKLIPLPEDSMEHPKPLRLREQVLKGNETVSILGRITEQNGIRVISASRDGSSFLISDRSQNALVGTLYWRVISRTAVLTAIGVYIARFFQT